MKKLFALLSLLCVCTSSYGQEKELEAFKGLKLTTRAECTRRCILRVEQNPKYASELAAIKEKHRLLQAKETVPEKLKELRIQEEAELETFYVKCEDSCKTICKNNPEKS